MYIYPAQYACVTGFEIRLKSLWWRVGFDQKLLKFPYFGRFIESKRGFGHGNRCV